MQPTPRATVLLTALGVGVLQIVGSIGAANNQPDRKGLDVLAVALRDSAAGDPRAGQGASLVGSE